MFRYILRSPLGEELGEATHRFLLEPGEVLTVGEKRLRVIDVTPIEEQGAEIVALVHVQTG
jgi:hypothetical protein